MSPRWLHWPAFWSPSDLADLRAWYDADDSTTIFDATTGGSLPSSGNDVGRWEDKSGGGYHVTQATAANRPHYVTNTLNGKPVIECTAQWLTAATASDWTFLHDATGSTCALVWQAGFVASPNAAYAAFGTHGGTQDNTGINLLYDDRSSLSRNDRIVSLVNRGVASTSASINISGDDAHTANVFHVVTMTTDPANSTASNRSKINIDGNTAIANNAQTDTHSSSAPSYALHVGAQGNGNSPTNGYIAELVICDAILTAADREKLEGYLAHKWGLESNLPSTHPYRNSAP